MYRVLIVLGLAAVIMLAAFRYAQWYADNSALPRFCDDPVATVGYVRRILTSDTPAGDDKRRPYVIAAKLIFLVPQQDGEDLRAYLDRLADTIAGTCRSAY